MKTGYEGIGLTLAVLILVLLFMAIYAPFVVRIFQSIDSNIMVVFGY